MAAYYNEHDKKAAAWLLELISQGLIAYGHVDTRSIEDVRPNELRGYTQCHFFAGIGGWSLALRRAGWPDDRPIWTGSCPCQPFSAAGAGVGFADERHLWPAFYHLIDQRKPECVFGEQVASKDADAWIDLVHTDMEAVGYALGAIPFPSAGVGAPHIRDRTYWMGHSHGARSQRYTRNGGAAGRKGSRGSVATSGIYGGMADTNGRDASAEREQCIGEYGFQQEGSILVRGESAGIGDRSDRELGPCPTNGIWSDADWLFCRDGKWRPVEPSTFPLANGVSGRVGLLRGYGNAINVEAAKAFIEAAMYSIG